VEEKVQDPVKLAPEIYKVLLENDLVRVLEIHLKPGGHSPMHSHPAYIAYALTDSKVRFTLADGKTKELEMKAGEAAWSDAESHAVDNIGSTEARVLNIELKLYTKGQ
jgi:quercetin dioxygenase-like cupin family protein